jgi:hypothetical protein
MSKDFSGLRFGVATASLGMNEIHTLDEKFRALQKAGITFTELGFGAYVSWVREQLPNL